eukprot:758429-Hanusia_phi.AAC.2
MREVETGECMDETLSGGGDENVTKQESEKMKTKMNRDRNRVLRISKEKMQALCNFTKDTVDFNE